MNTWSSITRKFLELTYQSIPADLVGAFSVKRDRYIYEIRPAVIEEAADDFSCAYFPFIGERS